MVNMSIQTELGQNKCWKLYYKWIRRINCPNLRFL